MLYLLHKRNAARDDPVIHTFPRRTVSRSKHKYIFLNYDLSEEHRNAWEISSIEVRKPGRQKLIAHPITMTNQYGHEVPDYADDFASRLIVPEERSAAGELVISPDAPDSIELVFTISHIADSISPIRFRKHITVKD